MLSSTTRAHAGWVALALMAALAGCAGSGKAKPQPVEKALPAATASTAQPAPPAAAAPVLPAGPSVTRLSNGREGFVITETGKMDADSRKDFERAVALLKSGDAAQAIPLLEKVIEHSPGITAPYINLAIAYGRTGKPEKAGQHLKTALGLVPGHPVASNEYGLMLRKSGRFSEARAVYEKALEAFPDYKPAHRNLGILCDLYLGDLSCALKHYEIYSGAMPQDEQVKMWIADLQARLGR